MNQRQTETLALIIEVMEATKEKDPITRKAKLDAWSAKVDRRENIFDRIARLKNQK